MSMCKKEFVSNLFSSLMVGMKSCTSTTAEIETWLLWTRYSELHLSVGFFFCLFISVCPAEQLCSAFLLLMALELHCGRTVKLPVLICRTFMQTLEFPPPLLRGSATWELCSRPSFLGWLCQVAFWHTSGALERSPIFPVWRQPHPEVLLPLSLPQAWRSHSFLWKRRYSSDVFRCFCICTVWGCCSWALSF